MGREEEITCGKSWGRGWTWSKYSIGNAQRMNTFLKKQNIMMLRIISFLNILKVHIISGLLEYKIFLYLRWHF